MGDDILVGYCSLAVYYGATVIADPCSRVYACSRISDYVWLAQSQAQGRLEHNNAGK